MPELRQKPGIGQGPTWPGGNGSSLSLAADGAGRLLLGDGVPGELVVITVVVVGVLVVEVVVDGSSALLCIVTLTSLLWVPLGLVARQEKTPASSSSTFSMIKMDLLVRTVRTIIFLLSEDVCTTCLQFFPFFNDSSPSMFFSSTPFFCQDISVCS